MGNSASQLSNEEFCAKVNDVSMLMLRKEIALKLDVDVESRRVLCTNTELKKQAVLDYDGFMQFVQFLTGAISRGHTPGASSGSEKDFGVRESHGATSPEAKLNVIRKSDGVSVVDEDDEKQCSICLEKDSNLVLPCLHAFCEACLKGWLEKNMGGAASCPFCRLPIRSQTLDDDAWQLLDDTPVISFIWAEIVRLSKIN